MTDKYLIRRLDKLNADKALAERDQQDTKWGIQKHSLPEWLAILSEEVGELAAAILHHEFGDEPHPNLNWRDEAVQVAAVALAMLTLTPEDATGRNSAPHEATQDKGGSDGQHG